MKLSLITVVYNAAATIEATIKAVITQTIFSDIEYIVIDGGSTDGSRAIIDKYDNYLTQKVYQPDKGLYDALNKGISLASNEVIAFIHADDVLANAYTLSAVMEQFNNKETDALYGDLLYVSNNLSQTIRYWKSGVQKSFALGWMPPHPSLFVKKSVYNKIGLFRLDLGSAADYEWMLRAIHINKIKVAYLPEVLVKMRVGGMSNQNLNARKNAWQMDLQAWKVNTGSKNYLAVFLKKLRKIPQFFHSLPH